MEVLLIDICVMVLYISFLLGILVVSIGTADIKFTCFPGEVLKPYTFTFNVSQSATFVTWKHGEDNNIADCTKNVCSAQDPSMYAVSRSGQSSSLTILNVTIHSRGSYSCAAEVYGTTTCDFTVFAKPEHVVCQDAEFQAQTNEVNVVCTAQRVYPNPKCHFTWFLNDTMNRTVPENLITYDNMQLTGDDDYFKAKCSLKLPARNFSVGSHQFQVRVYPNVTEGDNDTAYGIDSSLTSPQSVAIPSVKLKCPDTYVEESTLFNCTCRESANVFILSTTTLSYGTTTVNSSQNVTGSFTADRSKGEVTCTAQLPDGTNKRTTQTVQVAYGPSSVALRVNYNQTESDVISLCDQPVTVTATCSVPANNSNPGVNYQFYSNVTDTSAGPSSMSAVNYTARTGGLFSFLCTANNSQFSRLSATSLAKIIQVTEPPSPPVIERYQDGGTSVVGDQLIVQEGVAKIRCRVEGGYPPVSGVLLECGSQTSKDNNLYIDVNISRHMDGTNCSCTATHSSSCYRNNKALTVLDVHFGPSIFNFEVNNNSQQIIVEKNSSLSFSCQAEGNPFPRLSLRKNGAELEKSSNPTQSEFNVTLTYSKPMAECLDTGVYMCLAEGGQTTTNKSVVVYLKCKPEFRNPDSLSKNHKVQVNGTLSIGIPVFGYPEPNMNLSSTKYTLSSDDYNLTYLQQEPPYGSVSLTIDIKNASYFQNYSLSINNTEGLLSYSFQIEDGDPVKSESGNKGSPGPDVGAIVGGIVAAVLVIVIIFVIIFFLKRKGAPCNKKQQNGNTLMHTPYGSDSSVNHHAEPGDAEVTVDNSDLYNLHWRSEEVEVDNSDLYNLNYPTPGRDSNYKNYSEVTPTITTATSVPLNMGKNKTGNTSNPYEDVSSGEISKPKPSTSQKPKPVAKPKPRSGKQEGKQAKNTGPDQTYALVVKQPKSDKPFAIQEEKDEFFLDPSLQPEIPEKNFENPYEDTNNEKSKDKNSSGRKKNKGKANGKASEQLQDPSSVAYTNSGFSNPDDEINVYANT